MTAEKLDRLGPALARVGEEAMRIVGGEPDGVYLYVEVGDGYVGPNLFKDEGDQVRFFWPYASDETDGASDLCDALAEAWHLEPEDKRWTAMHYAIDDGRFDAKFEYDDFEGSEESHDERRERILDARYGDKPRVYPPMPGDATELTPPS